MKSRAPPAISSPKNEYWDSHSGPSGEPTYRQSKPCSHSQLCSGSEPLKQTLWKRGEGVAIQGPSDAEETQRAAQSRQVLTLESHAIARYMTTYLHGKAWPKHAMAESRNSSPGDNLGKYASGSDGANDPPLAIPQRGLNCLGHTSEAFIHPH